MPSAGDRAAVWSTGKKRNVIDEVHMNMFEAISKRYSCRKYIDKPIEKEKLARIFEAARLAPSAKNLQDWRFVVVTDKDKRTQIAHAAYEQMFLAEAGAIIVACSNNDYIMRCGQPLGPIDVAIALEHIALQAVEEGLATCWIGSFEPDTVRQILAIPRNIQIIELMGLGYSAGSPPSKPNRQPVTSIVCYNMWHF
jgi:nitroreductase